MNERDLSGMSGHTPDCSAKHNLDGGVSKYGSSRPAATYQQPHGEAHGQTGATGYRKTSQEGLLSCCTGLGICGEQNHEQFLHVSPLISYTHGHVLSYLPQSANPLLGQKIVGNGLLGHYQLGTCENVIRNLLPAPSAASTRSITEVAHSLSVSLKQLSKRALRIWSPATVVLRKAFSTDSPQQEN